MTLSTITKTMKTLVDFKFITVDRLSIKLWIDKPRFDCRANVWMGTGCIAMLDIPVELSSYKTTDGEIVYKLACEVV